MRNVLLIASLAVVAAASIGCSSSDRPSTQTLGNTPSATAPKAQTPSSTSAAKPTGPVCTAADFKVAGEFGAKPTVTVPTTCQPGPELIISDLKPGTGPEVKKGSTAEVNYQLTTFSDKQIADESFGTGQTFPVENVGAASVIKGWNEGLIGLKEGGRRLLIIPPSLGYGPQGSGSIQPNETLIFVVDAVKVTG
ncbi:FKBP-type peptidylprolyl isomerase [Lentzea tibetensis]|uniref:Peptidyl-prolyl cis-trans isomerase n=1 Tax=Lentzea tibetensis TaxID=2591470 RepID=A0A563EWI3_9PSEU|nr:FKBP-type peptidyl-prolyl cis-trans isomerase [Lentzea tibetensis]TWP51932.1 FKBP-type peptidylprolyl isomerase [Lentzea tibetensis]